MFRTQNHQVQYNCLRCTLKLTLKDNLSSVYLYLPSRCHLLNISVNVLLLKFKFKKTAYYMHKELRRGKALIFWIPMARHPEIKAQVQPELTDHHTIIDKCFLCVKLVTVFNTHIPACFTHWWKAAGEMPFEHRPHLLVGLCQVLAKRS